MFRLIEKSHECQESSEKRLKDADTVSERSGLSVIFFAVVLFSYPPPLDTIRYTTTSKHEHVQKNKDACTDLYSNACECRLAHVLISAKRQKAAAFLPMAKA